MIEGDPRVGAFRPVPRTGVIYVTTEAAARGYRSGDPSWANLGQGSPEVGPLEGAPERITSLALDVSQHRYAPVGGTWELREAVAEYYNQFFRRGKGSRYSAENVCISGGGRLALTRAVAALGSINLGHFLPDYTAYEELLSIFRLFSPIAILLDRERGYRFDADDLRREIVGRGLGAVLRSNPCNPTGEHLRGDALAGWVGVARETDCTLLMDEFYSHYAWSDGAGPTSAAAFVEDVDRDPVVIVDGLTKNWRYPGWRVCWTVAPKKMIEAVTSAGSFLDGGAAAPMQHATIPLLEPGRVRQEVAAIRKAFLLKRQRVVDAAREMGLVVDAPPEGTFYAWASLEKLPPPFDDGMTFFRRALEWRVICVPGEFFDVNPGKRRPGHRGQRFSQFVRLSFGPALEEVELALKRLKAMIPSL
ncbi:MAG: pyridoxal phosphate-dependent aminotransferase [Planctomycetota bacterium]|nr:pyridoxal phosphate-dependent aminotransferase [Planctomycetota bacterium]